MKLHRLVSIAAAVLMLVGAFPTLAGALDADRMSEVDFGTCTELSTGTVTPLPALQSQVPNGVMVLSLTAQGTVFPGSDDLGVLITRALACESISVADGETTRTEFSRHISHVGSPVATAALPASSFSNDGGNGADFNNYIFGYYSDSSIYRDAMHRAGVAGVAPAQISMSQAAAGDCLVDRTVNVRPSGDDAFGYTANGVMPDAKCQPAVVPFIANWWSVNDDSTAVLSNNIVAQSAVFIDTAETIISVTPSEGSALTDLIGMSATSDAFGVVGHIPETDGIDMVITALDSASDSAMPMTSMRESGLTVTVQEAGDVTLHSLVAPESVFANATHIVETENALVVFDTQFLLPFAADARAYADSTGKPIEAVFITHEHPDHFLGSEAFADVPVFALAEVVDAIAANGDAEVAEKQGDFGPELIASTYVVPEVVEPGTVEIDGVAFELGKVLDAEAEFQLVTRIPSAGAIVTGDLVYSGVHLILAGPADTWTVALEGLMSDSDAYPVVLAGHGAPADTSVYDANIEWLAASTELLETSSSGAEFKQAMIDAFPDLGMADAIDFVLPFFFPNDSADDAEDTSSTTPSGTTAIDGRQFTTHMFGTSEIPANTSSGVGWSTWQVDDDTMHFRMVLSRLEGAVTGAHLHQAGADRNGPVVAALDISSTTALDGSTAQMITGTISAADFSADLEGRSMAALVGAIEFESIYINVHTDLYPGGEVRGQLQ